MFTENAVFTGKTGDAVKSYLGEAHITILSGIKVTAQTLLDNMAAYKDGYRAIDSSTNFKLDEEAIQEFRKKLASNYEDTDEYTGKIRSALSEVSDISDVGMPDSNGVFDIHEQMDSDLIKLVSNVNSYERENVVRLENSVELLLENLQSCLSKIGLSQCAIESYETGSFITGKDAGTLNTGIKIFGDLHEKNKEAYNEIYETEQKIKDEAEKRKTQGIWRIVGGAVLIATGAACIVLTGGAATPIVADIAVAAGSGTAVFGAADAIEGTQDIYYGSTGDIDSTAVNGIKDDLFQGNEDAYYLTENAFAFASSAMIPIGTASKAGELTFRSGATIIAKEGISTAAGAGAQKVTTDLTGNQTAGMLAGMAASAATAKGLNGIEAGAKKLEKSKLGDVGAGGGAVLNDVGDGASVKSGINSYDEFSKAVSDIGTRSDLTDAQKIKELQKLFENSNYKADINVPGDIQYVKGFDVKGNVIYDWPPKLGFDESTIKPITRTDSLFDTWDRYGYMGGSNFADVPSTGRYTYSERAIPYVENEAAYHTGTFNNVTYFDKIDAIKNGDIDGLNALLHNEGISRWDLDDFEELCDSYDSFISKANKELGDSVDATYGIKGQAAEWGDMTGGAGQIVTPFGGNVLEKIGILKEN